MTTTTIPPFTGPWAESLTQYVELMLGLGRGLSHRIGPAACL